MKYRKYHIFLVCCLIAANLAFIWGNSLLPAAQSGELSGGLLARLGDLLSIFGDNAEKVLRKMAHMAEFASLGALLCWLTILLGKGLPLLPGLLAACIDETIQLYIPGRSSSLTDVWIDFAGVLLGIILVKIGQTLICKYKNRKENPK